nr:diguanylate cyclase [uncultured Acetobacterium sp.]
MNTDTIQRILIVSKAVEKIENLVDRLSVKYTVLFAIDEKTTLELSDLEKPDLILIDLQLPEMKDYSICKQLKMKEQTQHIPVMLFSERNEVDIQVKSLVSGAADYLVLPFNDDVVLAKIDNQLARYCVIKNFENEIKDKQRINKKILENEARLLKIVDILQHPSETIQEFLDYALKQAIELTNSKIGYIYHYNEEYKEFILNTWSEEVMQACKIEKMQTTYKLDKTGIWGEAVRQRRPIVVNDFEAKNPLKKGCPEGHVQLTKFLTVPIFKNEEIVSVVGLANKETDYDETDILKITLLMEAVWTVTESKKAEEALRASEEKLQTIIETSPDGIAISTMDGMVEFVTAQTVSMWGYDSADELIGRNIMEFVHESYHEKAIYFITEMINGHLTGAAEYLMVRKDGSQFYCETNANILRDKDKNAIGVLHIERDITERKELENELKDLAIKDQLTGLYNRRKIDEVLMKEKQQVGLSKQNLAIIMADIDMFKLVNDQHGHLVGDTVLIAVTKILSQGVRKTDIVGRWGGEEFMIVCPDTDLVGATVLAEKLREMVDTHDFEVVGKKTCSFGVAQLRKEETIDELLLRSDLALYRAKERGRNRVETEIRKDRPIKRMNSLQKKTRG